MTEPEDLDLDGAEGPAVMVRSEEEIVVSRQWRPAQKVRVAKRIVTETRSVKVRREELFFEELPPDTSDAASGPGRGDEGPWEFVLRQEQVVLVPVAVERIRVEVRTVNGVVDVSGEVRRERIEVTGLPESGVTEDETWRNTEEV